MSYAREVIRVARNYDHELTAAMDVDRLEEELDGYDAEIKELRKVINDFPVDKAYRLLDELECLRATNANLVNRNVHLSEKVERQDAFISSLYRHDPDKRPRMEGKP